MVLGVDQLRSLGPILWNFTDLTMQLTLNGAVVKLQGIYLSTKALEEENQVPKLKMGSLNGI